MQVIRHRRQSYPQSLAEQEARVEALLRDQAPPALILTEHPPIYTIGTSGREEDILAREIDGCRIAVYHTGRGGEVTYHGPGQLLCYLIADLRAERDLHRHIHRLEEMIIRALADFGLSAGRNPRGIGVWIGGRKIAAVGVRCRRWVTWHGIALNIAPELRHFRGIVPCGMRDAPVTSMAELGRTPDRPAVEACLIHHARLLFAPSGDPIHQPRSTRGAHS
ncbi:MAG: lipoyl(octanoyl) transferase [Zetaproteobacteria bacterium]|nr:MAG: lipoyl(octanoyl) transferase [Zetaproteobacteria bacterium]